MSFFTLNLDSMDTLYEHQVKDLYDASQRLHNTLPNMVEAANNPEVKSWFVKTQAAVDRQTERLKEVFEAMGKQPEAETCDAMKGIISEGKDYINAEGDPDVIDAALIATAQRIAHYNIAGYGTARNFANRVGKDCCVPRFQESLDEWYEVDKSLTTLAEESINVQATS